MLKSLFNLIFGAIMKILEVLQSSPEISCTPYVVERLTRWRPLRYDSFGPTSPYSNLEKVISLALKILIVPPLLIICSALDLILHINSIPVMYCGCSSGENDLSLKQYFLLLIAIVVRPLFAAAASLAGKSPEFICSSHIEMLAPYGHAIICDYNQLCHRVHDNTVPLPATNYEVIRKLIIKDEIDVDNKIICHKDKSPFLMAEAVRRNDLKLVRILYKIDSDLNKTNDNGEGILSYFIKNGPDEMDQKLLDYLIRKGIQLNPENCTPFSTIALVHGKFKLAKQLIKAGGVFHLKAFEQFETFINKVEIKKTIDEFIYDIQKFSDDDDDDIECEPSNPYLQYLHDASIKHELDRLINPMYCIESLQKNLAVEKKELLKLLKERIKAKGEVYLRIFDRYVNNQLPKEIWHKIAEFI